MVVALASESERGFGTGGERAPERHVPVLLSEVLAYLEPRPASTFVDATLGGGGYTEALLERTEPSGRVIALDRDRDAVSEARKRLAGFGSRLTLIWGSFSELSRHLDALDLPRVDGIVADLGLSSLQLDDAERGFAFSQDGPLDMRFDRSRGPTAAELVNTMDEGELAVVLRDYGEERRARSIARRLVARRPIHTTDELRRAVVSAVGPRRGRIDPATRTFQALRIAVNGEIDALRALLDQAPSRLSVGGRFVVVSYHSLEDREVKLAFRSLVRSHRDGGEGRSFRLLTKKPVVPGEDEIRKNRRARSAKLRVLERAT